jgi:ABC-type antimicrobial peptide transport system permease subunit
MSQYNPWYDADDAWGGIASDIQSFVLLQPGVTPGEVEAVLPEYVKKYRAESKNVHHYRLQPLDDIHFNPKYGGRMSKNAIWVLSLVGFFLILTACLNFINLATAQSTSRSREVGVRKALGSARAQLFWQFTTETGVIVVIATFLALCISYSLLPYVNGLFNTNIVLNLLPDIRLSLFLVLLTLSVTFLSGCYPGIILSGFRPVLALKGKPSGGGGNFNMRRTLITAQFAISQILLLGLIVVMYQMWYFKQSDLGFNQDAVVMIPVGSRDMKTNTLKSQFSQIPQVEAVSLCYAAPASESRWGTMFSFENRSETEEFSISFRGGDEHYLSTFDIDLVAGRNLTPSDTVREFLVNETFVSKLNLSSPEELLGKTISILGGSVKGPVVGVVNDFHDQSLRSDISPIFISTSMEHYNLYAVKLDMAGASKTLAALRNAWNAMYPDEIFEYSFLDDQIAEFYAAEETMLKLIKVFSFIALFIGSMGLYGLVSFMVVQKTKEIGIRKVLGASVSQLLWIFGKEFSRLVIIAFLLAAPIGWWLMSRWLESYAYRVPMTGWYFALEVFIIFLVVLLTVGYESVKTTRANPVNSLRWE